MEELYEILEDIIPFDISIPASEIVPDNFNSADSIWALIERLGGAG